VNPKDASASPAPSPNAGMEPGMEGMDPSMEPDPELEQQENETP
jgi:hypothetical protein